MLLLSNDTLGEFLINIDGTAQLPQPTKIGVNERLLDHTRVKLIKSSRLDDNNIALRCFSGDRIDVELLVPVCNKQRENAIIKATELRMSDVELKRRRLHGVLSSKSLLESLDSLVLNRKQIDAFRSKQKTAKSAANRGDPGGVTFSVVSKNPQHCFTVPDTLAIDRDSVKSDLNTVPLTISFSGDRPGNYSTLVELLSLPDDIRIIPVEFKVTESLVSDSSIAYLKFSSCVFDPIVQKIPLRNNSETACSYEVDIVVESGSDPAVFKGLMEFTIAPKEVYNYELMFLPSGEEKYDAELRFNNVTEGIQTKYFLSGQGERRPPLGEIKLETRVGQTTHHEILIPNKSNRKICFYVG